MPREKSDHIKGMELFLNNPNTSYKTNPKVFDEIHKKSGMSISEMFKHVGRSSKFVKPKEPTDKEKSEERLNTLESNSLK